VAFYEHVNQVAEALENRGWNVVVPKTAKSMQKTGNYSVELVKTWYDKPQDFTTKALLMRGHFDEVANGDAVLVVNDEKHGIQGYIGPNVLMEIGLAFYLEKPIYILNTIDKKVPVYEEVLGMNAIFLEGDLSRVGLQKSS
jgi:hypothetical protein